MNLKYHTYEAHVKPMLNYIDEHLHLNGNGGESKKKILKLATIFHDCCYTSGSTTNEDDSIEVFKHFCSEGLYGNYKNIQLNWDILLGEETFLKDIVLDKEDCNFATYKELQLSKEEYHKVIELINNTKTPFDMRYGDELGHIFAKLDVYVLTQDFYSLMIYEHRIYNEFKEVCTLSDYKKGRIEFLTRVINELPSCNIPGIEKLIGYINIRSYGTLGIFAGSFDPFTIGHLNVLEQAKKNFDNIIVVRMVNYDKTDNKGVMLVDKLDDVVVIESDKLLVDLVQELKEGYKSASVIRALRNGSDLQYEQNLRSTVKDFDNSIHFVYYLSDKEFSHVSSSMVRNLPENLRYKYLV